MVEISRLFFQTSDDPTIGADFFAPDALDYSIESLATVDDYLDKVRQHKDITSVWNKVALRCGAYVGEVVRRNCEKRELHWVDYENALELDNTSFQGMGQSIGNSVSLYGGNSWFCFPLAKVDKFLENGREDSVHSFAEVIIDIADQD